MPKKSPWCVPVHVEYGHDPVVLGERVAHRPVQVGERGEHAGENVGEPGTARTLSRERDLLDEVLDDKFSDGAIEVPSVDDLVDEAVQERATSSSRVAVSVMSDPFGASWRFGLGGLERELVAQDAGPFGATGDDAGELDRVDGLRLTAVTDAGSHRRPDPVSVSV